MTPNPGVSKPRPGEAKPPKILALSVDVRQPGQFQIRSWFDFGNAKFSCGINLN